MIHKLMSGERYENYISTRGNTSIRIEEARVVICEDIEMEDEE